VEKLLRKNRLFFIHNRSTEELTGKFADFELDFELFTLFTGYNNNNNIFKII
jgi:hypothetical protein